MMTYVTEANKALQPWLDWAKSFPAWSKVWIDDDQYRRLDAAHFRYRLALGLPLEIPAGHVLCLRTIKVLSRESRQ